MYSKMNTPPGCLKAFKTEPSTRGKLPQNHIYGHSKEGTDKARIGITPPIGVFQQRTNPLGFVPPKDQTLWAPGSSKCESASELRADETSDTRDNKSQSKPRLPLKFPQENPVFITPQEPPKNQGLFPEHLHTRDLQRLQHEV